jgi:hypothetical protein
LGKFLSAQLLELLQDKAQGFVVIVLDDDALVDAKRLYRELNFGNLRDRIRLVKPPEGYDPSKLFEKFSNKGIVALLRTAYKLEESDIY